ncbi:MAG TPA: formate dehydrogenase accessory sulfurtransferase FdhD [Syntrophobacteraceae bacterium]|nr:formate dehydrogenase accessory sulfurtransferase FdhD [Syntrophobacteraceae bacterium]
MTTVAGDNCTMSGLLDQQGMDSQTENTVSVAAFICESDGEARIRQQHLIRERPVTIFVNDQELVTLLCTGHHLDELAAGFLRAEGFIESREDVRQLETDAEAGIVRITICQDTSFLEKLWNKRTITSGCGKGTLFYHAVDALLAEPVNSMVRIDPLQIWERMQDLSRLSQTYRHTHGVHNTALADPDNILLFRDDIGRHNAVDMIIGYSLLHGLSLADKILITTGRLTSEILIKAAKVGLPVLASRNTATSLAVELATALNITLIGYVRNGKSTVYSGHHRVACGLPAPGK